MGSKRTGGTKGKGTTTKGGTTPTKGGNTPTTGGVTFTPPVPVTPVNKRGNSTVQHPVGTVWVTCITHTLQNGGTPPTRGTLHTVCMGVGVGYYTTRTQVQRYLQWYRGGCNPTGLPRGVVVTPTVLTTLTGGTGK